MSEGTITSYILELGGLLGDYEKVETCTVEEQVEKLIIEKARELVAAADGEKKSEMLCNGAEKDSIDGAAAGEIHFFLKPKALLDALKSGTFVMGKDEEED